MSESTIDKTARKITQLLESYTWRYQYSYFSTSEAPRLLFLDDASKLRERIKSLNRKVPILFKINLSKQRYGDVNPFITFYSPKSLNILDVEEDKFNPLSRSIPISKIQSTINTLRTQKPHNLKRYFENDFIGYKRYGVLNRRLLDDYKI